MTTSSELTLDVTRRLDDYNNVTSCLIKVHHIIRSVTINKTRTVNDRTA